jgi:hypothetical protein|tara:strand:+ start:230 stop:523 length:294 start_codon:yes stop_codon:yes gene_type:complete
MKVRELVGELWKLDPEAEIGFALTLPQSEWDKNRNNPITDDLDITLEDWIHIDRNYTELEDDYFALMRFRVDESQIDMLPTFQDEGRMNIDYRKLMN